MNLTELLKRDEGVRLFPYKDTADPPRVTIGVGRNLSDVGLSLDEVDYLMANDIKRAKATAQLYPWFGALDDDRKTIVLSMIFNLGAQGFAGFHRFIAAMSAGNYTVAANEIIDSEIAKNRAARLAQSMRTGVLT